MTDEQFLFVMGYAHDGMLHAEGCKNAARFVELSPTAFTTAFSDADAAAASCCVFQLRSLSLVANLTANALQLLESIPEHPGSFGKEASVCTAHMFEAQRNAVRIAVYRSEIAEAITARLTEVRDRLAQRRWRAAARRVAAAAGTFATPNDLTELLGADPANSAWRAYRRVIASGGDEFSALRAAHQEVFALVFAPAPLSTSVAGALADKAMDVLPGIMRRLQDQVPWALMILDCTNPAADALALWLAAAFLGSDVWQFAGCTLVARVPAPVASALCDRLPGVYEEIAELENVSQCRQLVADAVAFCGPAADPADILRAVEVVRLLSAQ